MRYPNVLNFALASALLLSASGCESSQPARGTSAEYVRVILIFNATAPAPDDSNLTALLAEACNCAPRFIRRYLNNGLIYQVSLNNDQTFTSFSHSLLAKGLASGIQSVEHDTLQHQ